MAKQRPDTSPSAVEQILITNGSAKSMAGAVKSDFKLIVPVLIKELDGKGIEECVMKVQNVYEEENLLSNHSAEGIAEWAEYGLNEYKIARLKAARKPSPRPDTSPAAVKQTLIALGYDRSDAHNISENFRLIVPIVLKNETVENLSAIMTRVQPEYILHDTWLPDVSVKETMKWSEYVLKAYKE